VLVAATTRGKIKRKIFFLPNDFPASKIKTILNMDSIMATPTEDFDIDGQFRLMGYLQENFGDDMEEGLKQLGPTKIQKIMQGGFITETDSSDGVLLPPQPFAYRQESTSDDSISDDESILRAIQSMSVAC